MRQRKRRAAVRGVYLWGREVCACAVVVVGGGEGENEEERRLEDGRRVVLLGLGKTHEADEDHLGKSFQAMDFGLEC